MAEFRVEDLRTAYMPGRAKIGRVDVSPIGLAYQGKRIGVIEFARHNVVRYYEPNAAFCFATFSSLRNTAGLDD